MADSRPADDLTAAVANLRKEFDDRIATLMARSNRRPVGTIEMTLRTASLTYGTLVCNGAAVSRTTYADLWAWANDSGALTAGFLGTGDGSTTFTLPDLGGKFVVGAGAAGYNPGTTGGAETVTLTTAEMPAHDHGATSTDGDHGGHTNGSLSGIGGGGSGVARTGNATSGSHWHTIPSDGDGGAHENRPPYLALYYVIWF